MKYQIWALVIFSLFALQPIFGAGEKQMQRIKPPKECRSTRYSCILKKTDGVPFYCVRTTKQRYQNARKSIRVVSERNCLRRYPVEYETIENPPEQSE